MTERINRRILLDNHPAGQPVAGNFRLERQPIGEPGEGQVLLRTLWLSLDPFMRGRMRPGPSYIEGVPLGEVMCGFTVCEVLRSRDPRFAPGDLVRANTGWQDFALADGKGLTPVPPGFPVTAALGMLGMPSRAAYFGVLTVGQPKPGETVLISAASGAVGAVAAQIARIIGCRVVGIAGGEDKCAYLRDVLGVVAVDRKHEDFPARLAAACPQGVDFYFDNTGGDVLRAALPLMNIHGRIGVCGAIAVESDEPGPGLDRSDAMLRTILIKRLTVRGFIAYDFADREEEFRRDMSSWIAAGQLIYREHVVEGLENAPEALAAMFRGENFGKLLVRVAPQDGRGK